MISTMQRLKQTSRLIAPIVLRYAMGVVVLWFSLQQFIHPADWVAYIPDSVVSLTGLSTTTIIYLNAIFELVFASLLLLGKYTRLAATLLALHLLDIMWVLGYGEIAIRDFGLALGLLSVALYGPDILSADAIKPDAAITSTPQPLQTDNTTHTYHI